MTDAEFFGSQDLTRPELEDVRAAADGGDFPAARHAFVEHVKTRPRPRWYFEWRDRPQSPEPPTDATRGNLRVADEALHHCFTVCGLAYTFEADIDWRFNPTTVEGSKYAQNHEWTWQFNRHSFWGDLGDAYWETGDERYAEEFVAQMLDWVAKNPAPGNSTDQKPFSRWRTIEAGIRMSGAWPTALYRCLSSPAFTDDAVIAMVGSMIEHARYLMAHPTRGNWLTMEMSGLYTVGALFPEFREAAAWRDYAADRLRQDMVIQVYPDGAQYELAPGYHNVSLANMCKILRLALWNDYPLPEGYRAGLEQMFAYNLWMMTPDRALPEFNDSGHGPGYVVGRLKNGLDYFPDRADFEWIVTDGKEGAPPDHTSHAFAYAGYLIQRSGWDRDARYLAFDAGPFGAGHQHEDKLNFVLMAYGKELVVEGGIYMYDASEWRKYVISPYAHNVVFVDWLGQNRRGVQETYLGEEPLPFVWQSTEQYDYAQGTYGGEFEGFGKDRAHPATHTRRILFVKEGPGKDFWVVADTLTPADDQMHWYESVFHLDAPDVRVDEASCSVVTANEEAANIGIFPMMAIGLKVSIVKGQEEPFVQGWKPLRDATMTGVRPIPTPTFALQGAGVQHLLYVFYPAPKGLLPEATVKPWPVEGVAASDGVAAEIGFPGGRNYRVFFPIAAKKTWDVDGEAFQGNVLLSGDESNSPPPFPGSDAQGYATTRALPVPPGASGSGGPDN